MSFINNKVYKLYLKNAIFINTFGYSHAFTFLLLKLGIFARNIRPSLFTVGKIMDNLSNILQLKKGNVL